MGRKSQPLIRSPPTVALTRGRLGGHRGGDERRPVGRALSEASTGPVCRTRSPAHACWSVSKEAAGLSPDWGWDTAGPPEKNLHQPCLQGAPCTTGCVRSLRSSADHKGPQTGGITALEAGDRDPGASRAGFSGGLPSRLADGQASPRVLTPACMSASKLPLLGRTAVTLELGTTPPHPQ